MLHDKYKPSNLTKMAGRGKKLPQYIAALSVCLGAMAGGSVLGWTGNISEDMKSSTYNGIKIDDDSLGWIGSIASLGTMAACYPIGKLCDLLGRKLAMLLLTIPFVTGWLLIIFANSLVMIYTGRFLTGMAGGAFCVSAPIYTTEIAEKEIRGALGSYFDLLVTVGILLAYGIPMLVDIKTFTIILALLPLVFAIVFVFQPESPVYLIKQNKEEEAGEALIQLRGKSYDFTSEIAEIKATLAEEQSENTSLFQSIKSKATKKASLICFSLMFFQQACGINAVILYATTIFQYAGTNINPHISTLIIGVMQIVATLISTVLVDRLGRRFLLIASNLALAISATLLAIFFTLQERKLIDQGTIDTLGFIPVFSLSAYVIMFSFGMGPIPWMLSAELFPTKVKSLGTGLAATFNWFVGFIVTKFYLNLQNAIGGDATFYMFAGVSLAGTIFVFLFLPETKGKTLDQIQRELNEETPRDEKRNR